RENDMLAGDLYASQGASWPVELVVIQGRGASSRPLPAVNPPVVVKDRQQLFNLSLNLSSTPTTPPREARNAPAFREPSDHGSRPAPEGPMVKGYPHDMDDASSLRGRQSLDSSSGDVGRRSVAEGLPEGRFRHLHDDPGNEVPGADGGLQATPSGHGSVGPDDGTSEGGGLDRGGGFLGSADQLADSQQSVAQEPSGGSGRSGGPADRADAGRAGAAPGRGTDAGIDSGPAVPGNGASVMKKSSLNRRAASGLGSRSGGASRALNAPVSHSVASNIPKQIPYVPRSKAASLDTLVPANLAQPLGDALDRLEAKVGDIDGFVAGKLGLSKEKLFAAFGAEQIDDLALAIDQVEQGESFINGSQAGIGKGRWNAGMIAYAMQRGFIPAFVTERPDLYKDIMRDLHDTGLHDFRALPTNAGLTGQAAIELPNGDLLSTQGKEKHDALLDDIARTGEMKGYDGIFTTYSQAQTVKGGTTVRRRLLDSLSPRIALFRDESHNAGGDAATRGKASVDNRADFMRSLGRSAAFVTDSSATWAKRPDMMDLYANTGLRHAVSDPKAIGEAISAGGVPLQQVVSAMLAASGQYVRRERDLSGITYDFDVASVDPRLADRFSAVLAAIQEFDGHKQQLLAGAVGKDLARIGAASVQDPALGDVGATSTAFSSLMHNLVGQGLLAMKADRSAEAAIAALERGKTNKVLIDSVDKVVEEVKGFSRDQRSRTSLVTPPSGGADRSAGPEAKPGGRPAFEGSINSAPISLTPRAWAEKLRPYALSADHHRALMDLEHVVPPSPSRSAQAHTAHEGPALSAAQVKEYLGAHKPIIALANTMGAFIEQMAADTGILPGEPFPADFGRLLDRYLERSRDVLVGQAFGDKERVRLTDSQLGRQGLDIIKRAKALIENTDWSSMPVSPIDHIRLRLEKAGYQVGEITGRHHIVDYVRAEQQDGSEVIRPTYRVRSAGETSKAEHVRVRDGFNEGRVDAVILNQAGASGISLHASEAFSDRRPRTMHILQAHGNIDTHIQMLGRPNRTGQVWKPSYKHLIADLPAERRPAAVLAGKLASLNATTTGSRGGDIALGTDDLLNDIGDRAVARLMGADRLTHWRLGSPLKIADRGDGFEAEDAARKVTGRIVLLPVAEQRALYRTIEEEYKAELERSQALGIDQIEAKTIPLGAKPLDRVVLIDKRGTSPSPFAGAAWLQRMDVEVVDKPYTWTKVESLLGQALGAKGPVDPAGEECRRLAATLRKASIADLDKAFAGWKERRLVRVSDKSRPSVAARLDADHERVKSVLNALPIGSSVRFDLASDDDKKADPIPFWGVVAGVRSMKRTDNPCAPGDWRLRVLVADGMKEIDLPFSQLALSAKDARKDGRMYIRPATQAVVYDQNGNPKDVPVREAFERGAAARREVREMVTGNLLAAYASLGRHGRTVFFTDESGAVRPG
ncbi:MAG: hypothetical protein EPN20_03070, partial [Magnetospirillum sp.]